MNLKQKIVEFAVEYGLHDPGNIDDDLTYYLFLCLTVDN